MQKNSYSFQYIKHYFSTWWSLNFNNVYRNIRFFFFCNDFQNFTTKKLIRRYFDYTIFQIVIKSNMKKLPEIKTLFKVALQKLD